MNDTTEDPLGEPPPGEEDGRSSGEEEGEFSDSIDEHLGSIHEQLGALVAQGEALPGRFDELTRELRRQGRAAVAAQAAAEACLEAIKGAGAAAAAPAAPGEGERWLRALLPVLDAVERVAAQAQALRRPRPAPGRPLLQRLLGVEPPQDAALAADLAALSQGLSLLKTLAEQSLEPLGVRVDRKVGSAVDPAAHRVVEARGEGDEPRVVEVVRAGYWLGESCVREADVVATRPRGKSS